MTDVYVVRNQLGQFWGKAKAWTDGRDPRAILRTTHEDEAMNTLFELSSKDVELRGMVVHVSLSERRDPVVEPSKHLIEPQAKIVAEPETEQQLAAETEQGSLERATTNPAEEPSVT
jgi:hypothetical protein